MQHYTVVGVFVTLNNDWHVFSLRHSLDQRTNPGNPDLATLISDKIGDGWVTDLGQLEKLLLT